MALSDLRAYRVQTEVVDVATGFSNMAFVTISPGLLGYDVRYRFGQTGFILGATVGGATAFYPASAGMTSGLALPATAIGGVPVSISGPVPMFLGSLGTSGVGFEITRYFSSGK